MKTLPAVNPQQPMHLSFGFNMMINFDILWPGFRESTENSVSISSVLVPVRAAELRE
jgi:hypothetical protein